MTFPAATQFKHSFWLELTRTAAGMRPRTITIALWCRKGVKTSSVRVDWVGNAVAAKLQDVTSKRMPWAD